MVNVLTTAAGAGLPPASDSQCEVPAPAQELGPRCRIVQLREAIEAGEYRISAAELADALLRAARRAN